MSVHLHRHKKITKKILLFLICFYTNHIPNGFLIESMRICVLKALLHVNTKACKTGVGFSCYTNIVPGDTVTFSLVPEGKDADIQ